MTSRILDPDAVNRMIPLVQHIADDLTRSYEQAADALENTNDSSLIGQRLDDVQRCVDEMEALGGTVRSYAPVRIDFMAEVDGEIGYVCWETGDEEAMCFHAAMEGCNGLVLSRTI